MGILEECRHADSEPVLAQAEYLSSTVPYRTVPYLSRIAAPLSCGHPFVQNLQERRAERGQTGSGGGGRRRLSRFEGETICPIHCGLFPTKILCSMADYSLWTWYRLRNNDYLSLEEYVSVIKRSFPGAYR